MVHNLIPLIILITFSIVKSLSLWIPLLSFCTASVFVSIIQCVEYLQGVKYLQCIEFHTFRNYHSSINKSRREK